MEPLQRFDHRSSPYPRPNQEWVCGWTDEGRACALGPDRRGCCRATAECGPVCRDGRWRCTRPESAGGPCAEGPGPEGGCGRPVAPCQPVRSWQARRRRLARWVLALTVGVLALGLGGPSVQSFVEPGARTFAHSQIGECAECHAAADIGPSGWLAAALHDSADGERCLACHDVGEATFEPHGLKPAALLRLRAETAGAELAGAGWPVVLASRWIDARPGALQCGVCHREHRGQAADLTQITAGRCQVCHSQQFRSLASGHPEFTRYPADRRSRIQFDHVSHFGKHFREPDVADAPQSCARCHRPDLRGQQMIVRPFAETCGGCHDADIAGDKRPDARGLAVLVVPGLDLETLRKGAEGVGEWPEFAEGRVAPLTDLLLRADAAYVLAREQLRDTDLEDLADAGDAQVAAARQVAWAFKRLVDALQRQGSMELSRRLKGMGMPAGMAPDLTGRLPGGLVDEAQRAWFPQLAGELRKLQAGERVATVALRPPPAPKTAPAAALPAAADEDLFGGGLLDAEPAAAAAVPAASAPAASAALPAMSPEERMGFGGWYLDDYVLRYRPQGHADPFLHAWLDAAPATGAFARLADPKGPGACTKCHSVDAVGGAAPQVNWAPKKPDPRRHPFTVFSHTAHFSLLGERGCATCHELDRAADFAAAFKGTDPRAFASNFGTPPRAACAQCHTPKIAGDDCMLCHRYHVGEFEATTPETALSPRAR